MGYEIAPLYDDAWTAWLNTEQHKNRSIPLGVDVPLFYSFTATIGGVRKNYGHINVRLKDGRVWNDGNIFSNLSSFEQSHSNVSYVGWGESVNKVRVIKENNVRNPNEKDVRDYFKSWLKRDPTATQIKHYTTRDWRYLIDYVLGEYKRTRDAEAKKLNDSVASLTKQLNDRKQEIEILQDDVAKLKVELKTLQNEWSACGKANNLLTKENEKLRAELGQTDKWTTFKALIRELFNFKGE